MRGTGSLGNQQPILPLLALPPIARPRSGPAAIPRPVPLPPLLHIAPIPRPRQLPRPRPPPSRLPPPSSPRRLSDAHRDFLRARDFPIWDKESKEVRCVRELGRQTPQTFEDDRAFVETRPPQVIANLAICLVHQANDLIDRQLLRLEKDFLAQGGLRERLTRVRLHHRNQPK